MPLAPGDQLGPYRIESAIGEGGMGAVYKAKDTRLDRTVAIKVSNEQFSERFEREARAIAQLNHPNICQLYDVGPNYLVMEFIEGTPLKSPLPLTEALKAATQICEALDAAHRKKITHRDLKPGNILVTKSGQIKLLDFGLAKITAPTSENDATKTLPLTSMGTIIGTLPYMAPEQLEGKEIDARTDIFAFGAVLYELITGKRPFQGGTQATLITEIMSKEPSTVEPPALDRVIRRCLAKNPDDRWQTARDLKESLSLPAETQARSSHPRPWIVATAVLSLALAALALLHFRETAPEIRVTKSSILPPDKSTFNTIAVSPDGRRIAFSAIDNSGKTQLWVRSLDSTTALPLPATDNASFPFWSPDSRFIGYFTTNKLMKIEASGGPVETICDATSGRGGAWNRDGTIIFGGLFLPLTRVQAAGGQPKTLASFDSARQELDHRWPAFLPDGRHFIYTVRSSRPANSGIFLSSLDSTERTRLLPDDSNAAFALTPDAQGRLLFARGGMLMAQPFDPAKLQLSGEAVPVVEQLGYNSIFLLGAFSISANGVLVYNSSFLGGLDNQYTWFDRNGKRLGTVGKPGLHLQPSFSPDEKQVVVDRFDTQAKSNDLWLLDLSSGVSTRFTFDPANDRQPVWSPDGSRIVFASNRDGQFNLYQKISSGAGKDELLLKSEFAKMPTGWSLDGRFLIYTDLNPKTKPDLWVLPMTQGTGGKPVPFLVTPFNEREGAFAPDGKWIAYTSDESGKPEVYVQPFPASGAKWQISNNGGSHPKWRRDGREIFYFGADSKIVAVEIKTGATLQVGVPQPLFDARSLSGPSALVTYAVTRDGQRFLIPAPVREESSGTPATLVVNWTAGLRK